MTPPPPATPRSVFTCCVGKTLSQAEFQLHSSHETAGLLDLLAHASLDLPTLGDQASPTAPQLPSVLERLPQLAKRLVGRQLLFVLDYDGCDDEGSSTNLARFLSVYPVARVLREADEGGDDDDGADGAAAAARKGTPRASGVGVERAAQSVRGAVASARRSRGSARRARAADRGGADPEMYRPHSRHRRSCARAGGVAAAISDNAFSGQVPRRVEEEVALTRGCVDEALRELPMLRCVDGRNAYEIRPDVERRGEAQYLVGAVVEQVGVKNALVVYVGEDDVFFRHVADETWAASRFWVTGGTRSTASSCAAAAGRPAAAGLCEQHAAGVTVRGKLRPPGRVREEGVRKGKGGKARVPRRRPPRRRRRQGREFPRQEGAARPARSAAASTPASWGRPATAPGHTRSLSGGKVDLGELYVSDFSGARGRLD